MNEENREAELQITQKQKEELEKQQYRFVGNHSAVKVCGWTKNHIMGRGVCYKYAFYGIRSHQCLQMTTSMFCASRCIFCWRGQKAPLSKEWYGPQDSPKYILENSIQEHLKLLLGFMGNKSANQKILLETKNVRHVALSLTGEPITYPKIDELLVEFHKNKISTFLVTNAQYPKEIENLRNVTQLYLSLDAPNMEIFKKIDRPLFQDYEERILKSLEVLSTRKYRTCIRLTLIKHYNMCKPEEYAKLIELGSPDFVELKSYMHVGASKLVLDYSDMPIMQEVREFSNQLAPYLNDYEIIAEHEPSRVVLLAKKSMKNKQYIDFKKFFDAVNNGLVISAKDYSSSEMCSNDL